MAIKKIWFGFYGVLVQSKPCVLREAISLSNCNAYEIISYLPINREKSTWANFLQLFFIKDSKKSVLPHCSFVWQRKVICQMRGEKKNLLTKLWLSANKYMLAASPKAWCQYLQLNISSGCSHYDQTRTCEFYRVWSGPLWQTVALNSWKQSPEARRIFSFWNAAGA